MYLAETLTMAAQTPVSGSKAPAGHNGSSTGGTEASSNPEGQFQNLLQQKHQAGLPTTEPSPLTAAIGLLPDNPLYQELVAALMAPPVALPQIQQLTPTGDEGPQPAGAAPLPLIAETPGAQPALTAAKAALPLSSAPQTAVPNSTPNAQQAQVPSGTPPSQTENGAAPFASNPEQDGALKQGDWETAALSQGQEAPAKPLFQSSEHLPVKVGETPVLPTDSADFELQLGKQLGQSLEQGTQKLAIRLTPEHLGTMVIEFTRSQDGTLHVLLNASNPEAASLLSQHKTGLGTLLQHNVQAPVYVEVQQQQDASQSSQQQNQQQHHNQGNAQQDARQQRQQEQQQNQDFLAQLRLGLVSLGTEAS